MIIGHYKWVNWVAQIDKNNSVTFTRCHGLYMLSTEYQVIPGRWEPGVTSHVVMTAVVVTERVRHDH